MVVSLGTLFCPNSITKISTKYMGALIVVDKIKDRNWSKYIHDWVMFYIKKYRKEPTNREQLTQTLGGCIYHLAVRCLDHIDFGPIQLPSTIPRIRVWKGKMIKVFSDMYMDTNGKYGAYSVKDLCDTCYSCTSNTSSEHVASDDTLKNEIVSAIGYILKEAISSSYVAIMKGEEKKVCMTAKDLVLQVVQAFSSNQIGSQDTIKISSSGEPSLKSSCNSGSTEIMPNEEEDDCNNETRIQRKRRRSSSQNSDECNNKRTVNQNMLSEKYTHMEVPNTEETKPDEATCSQHIHSTSLNHMVFENDLSKKQNDTNGVIESLMDLNLKSIEEEDQYFHGFESKLVKILDKDFIQEVIDQFPGLNEEVKNKSKSHKCAERLGSTTSLDETQKCRDVSLPNSNTLVQHYAKEQVKPEVILKRSEILELARNKYFFKDEGIPSFRMMEFMDDNGKTIEEPELHRPIEMDDFSYNEMCELAILRCKESENTIQKKDHYTCPSTKIDSKQHLTGNNNSIDIEESDYEMSIQCAQRATSTTGLTNSPKMPIPLTQQQNYVDLVSPIVTVPSQDHFNINQYSSSNHRTHDYSRALISGRRLFEGNEEDYCDSNSKNKFPVRELLNNFGNSHESSPEVQILGEKSFRYSYNSMSNQEDELYNTSLSLGNSGSREGKENCLPKRIPPRSKYLCSPYDVNPSPSVSIQPFEQKVWEAVTVLCDDKDHQLDWDVDIDAVKVKMLQLGNSMKPKGWLDAWVMNVFCRKLFRDKHPRFTKKTLLFQYNFRLSSREMKD